MKSLNPWPESSVPDNSERATSTLKFQYNGVVAYKTKCGPGT